MKDRKLTEAQYQIAVQRLPGLEKRSNEIAYGVLVEGKKQLHYVKKFDISPSTTSQIVKRVFQAYLDSQVPQGFERVSVLLPPHKAFLVKKWGNETIKILAAKIEQ